MYHFSGKRSKKLVTAITGAVLVLGLAFAGKQTVSAETVQNYSPEKAAAYAKEHWDDGKTTVQNHEDCIQFVRECMEAGGVPQDAGHATYGYTVEDYKDYLLKNGYAKLFALTSEKQEWETSDPQWWVNVDDNTGILTDGDGILYLCKDCGEFFHAALFHGVDSDGYAYYYAQNAAVGGNEPLCQINHAACKKNTSDNRANVALYSLHITSSQNGYKSDYDNKTVSNLKVLRTGVTTLNITWDAVDGAKGYRVYRKNGQNSALNLEADVTGTSITFQEPTKDAAYYFAVRPYFEDGGVEYVGKLSNIVKNDEEQATTKLAVPQKVTAAVTSGKVKVTWNKVAAADGYEVWRSTSANGTYYQIYSGDYHSCTNSSVKSGVTYYYKVRAIDKENAAFNSDFSSVVTQTVGQLPKTTAKVSVDSASGKLKLTWNAVEGAGQYAIYRSTKSSSGFSKINDVAGTSYTDTGAKAGTKYYYKVKAVNTVNSSATSAYSNTVSGLCKLQAPKSKISVTASTGKLKVRWGKVSGASKYTLYRATSQKGKYKKVTTTTKTSYTDKKASVGKKYYYKVVAVHKNTKANSAYSAVVSETCKLKYPTIKASNKSSKKIKLSWKKVSGASKYAIYRSTSKNGEYKKIATTKKTSYTNKSLKKGKTYYYKVVALHKKSAANSAYSKWVSKKCK